MDVKHRLQLYIQSQGADAAPPLGTVLGNLGVNTVNFCKDFNSFTADLPPYFTLAVEVTVLGNRSYKFSVNPRLPLGPIIHLLSKEIEGDRRPETENLPIGRGRRGAAAIIYRSMPLKQVILLALWQYPSLDLRRSLPLILGTLKSARIRIQV
jgi:ribosomal protein L11